MTTVWWSTSGIIRYNFLNPGEAITVEKYCQEIDKVHQEQQHLHPSLLNRKGPILLHDYPTAYHSFSALATNFPVIWASSAYKGANFPSAKYSDVKHYEMNNIAWIMTKQSQQHKFKKFHGIIITGWQRYDHMAPICEILPIGTPSMVLNIQIAIHGVEQNQPLIRNMAATILGCTGFTVSNLDIISNNCHFPVVVQMHNEIETIESEVREEMSKLFFDNTVEEFIYLTITPTADKLKHYLREIKRLSLIKTYPKRHFKILRKEL
uniref:Glycosyltransferase family 1 protein n=1 Tax=Heterorhabditis bacteriophora TaxID=37862 RepID=A0A1I7X318_HETBA